MFKDGSCDYGQNSYAWTRKVNKLNQYHNNKKKNITILKYFHVNTIKLRKLINNNNKSGVLKMFFLLFFFTLAIML